MSRCGGQRKKSEKMGIWHPCDTSRGCAFSSESVPHHCLFSSSTMTSGRHYRPHLRFILDSESRQVIFFFLPTYPPLTIGRVGPFGTGFIRPHPHRPFALEIGSSHKPSPPPRTLPWSIFLCEHDEDGRDVTEQQWNWDKWSLYQTHARANSSTR